MERIATSRARIAEHRPQMVLFYGAGRDPVGGVPYLERWSEIAGTTFKGFAKGGVRLLFRMGPLDGPEPAKIALTESGVEALSLAQLVGRRDTLFLSTGGALSTHTLNAIRAAATRYPAAEILLGFNADLAGDGFTASVTKALGEREAVRRVVPKAKDWNDQLTQAARLSAPAP